MGIVWFGEMVTEIENAVKLTEMADIFVIVGTSLEVYPAAGLLTYVRDNVPIYVIDPQKPNITDNKNIYYICETAVNGISSLKQILKSTK